MKNLLAKISSQNTNVQSEADTDPGRGTSRVMSQSRVLAMNHGCDSTDGAQGGASHENPSAGVPIPAALSNNQCGVLCEEGDWFRWEIARAIPV